MNADATKDSGSPDCNQEEQDVAGKEILTDQFHHPKKVDDLPPRLLIDNKCQCCCPLFLECFIFTAQEHHL